jgi:hypothetical protein
MSLYLSVKKIVRGLLFRVFFLNLSHHTSTRQNRQTKKLIPFTFVYCNPILFLTRRAPWRRVSCWCWSSFSSSTTSPHLKSKAKPTVIMRTNFSSIKN